MIRSCRRAFLSLSLLSSFSIMTACGEAPSETADYLNGRASHSALASLGSSYRANYSYRAQDGERFPHGPHREMTPGSKCETPDYHRYGERIPYCERNVKGHRKDQIFVRYDSELGYSTRSISRGQFKIDHHIPLCMGGSNEDDNLWPQHSSIYELTDPAEGYLCELMAAGNMRQTEAIDIIRAIKQTPERAAQILPGAY